MKIAVFGDLQECTCQGIGNTCGISEKMDVDQ